jgi:hypothetical protein
MRTLLRCSIGLLAAVGLLQAHFTFVVPQAGNRTAKVILSEDLLPETGVNIAVAKNMQLMVRDSAGKDTALTMTEQKDFYALDVPGKGLRIIHGKADLGISPSGRGPKPHWLLYYPKSLVGQQFGEKAMVGGDVPVELVPYGEAGAVKVRLLIKGQPQANTEMTLVLPGNRQKKIKTDAEGFSEVFTEHGRYGAWARYWEDATGEIEGKPYQQKRHYATLVFDALPKATEVASMPEASSSFGAVTDSGWLYVYGGHVAPTHNYSVASVSGKFHRLNLATKKWESLPAGRGLQGMNLVAYQGKIFRVGGMEPRNQPGQKQDIHSVAEGKLFRDGKWHDMASLPSPRSSHDAVVVDGKLMIVGGWNLKGEGQEWVDSMLMLDLNASKSEWQTLAQPFQRRAFIAAAWENKLVVMGGITKEGAVSSAVDIFDPATQTWSRGPELPGNKNENFAPAAAVYDGKLYVSLADGSVYQWAGGQQPWNLVGFNQPRLAHRMVAVSDGLLIIGGAEKGKNLALIEHLPLAKKELASDRRD